MKYYVMTYGCQMNVYDSAVFGDLLSEAGHQPAAGADDADLLLINTCAIRDSAEQRIHGQLGHMRQRKRDGLRYLAVCGCMAQNHQRALLERHPHLDLVMGTGSIPQLPELVSRLERGEGPIVACEIDKERKGDSEWPQAYGSRATLALPVHVSVQKGCNYNCTFCVVPNVRGPERYRPVDEVLAEVARLEQLGAGEVTLIGQTINAYNWQGVDFASLLARVAISTRSRIRFATSHPHAFSDRIIETIAAFDNICEYIHLPLQSGSDRILKRMARRYTQAEYLSLLRRIRQTLAHKPEGSAISCDVIVGFPGETEEDFQETLRVQQLARWDGLYSFKYSPRPGIAANRFQDPVPDDVSGKRLIRLQEIHLEMIKDVFAAYRGRRVEIVVEQVDKDGCRGRTRGNHVVISSLPDRPIRVGDRLWVRVDHAQPFTMRATPLSRDGEAEEERETGYTCVGR